MIILYRIRALVRWLLRRDEIERGLDTDLKDYIERSAAEKVRAGMTEAEARRAARIELGGTFPLVANPDLGLSAHLTPRGEWVDLYVVELTTRELVVRSREAGVSDVSFDYVVFGLRLGYEDQPVVRPRRGDRPPDAAAIPFRVREAVPVSRRRFEPPDQHARRPIRFG